MIGSACVACGKVTGIFRSRRLPDGSRVCKACQAIIPEPFLEEQYVSAQDVKNGVEYGKLALETLYPVFTATARYGRMALDERPGLFTICDATSIGKDGRLKAPSPEVYPCLAITEASFNISPISTAPVSSGSRTVACRVVFSGYLERCNIHVRAAIKKNVSCILIPDGEGQAVWREPDDLTAFRGCYRQMVETAWKRMQETERIRQEENRMEQEKCQKAQEEAERQARQKEYREADYVRDARILFMLGEDYTEADLKRQRAALMRAFHPDNGKTTDPAYAQKINDAYGCLLENIRRRGKT